MVTVTVTSRSRHGHATVTGQLDRDGDPSEDVGERRIFFEDEENVVKFCDDVVHGVSEHDVAEVEEDGV